MIEARRRRRPNNHRRGEHGLTLIELLLGLALMALLASFVAGGLVFARRAYRLDQTADLGADADAAVETVSDLLRSAVPLEGGREASARAVVYDGERDGVSFLGLGTGHALRGGLHVVKIQVDDGQLVAEIAPTRGEATATGAERSRRVVLLGRVKRARFAYFGSLDSKTPPSWRDDWSKAEALPLQVSLDLLFEDGRRPPPTLVVTLNQRE